MEKKQILLQNGETISYLEKGEGDKVLLLVHGNLSSSVYFKPLFDRIPESIRTIAVDLRGFGDSTYHQPIFTLKDLADDLALFLKVLGIKKVSLLGWSLGGGVAMEFSAKYQDLTTHLILMNSTSYKGYPVFKKNELGMPLLGQAYTSKEEMALDPVQVLPIVKALKDKNAAFMSYIYDLTIYTQNKPLPKDNELYIKETLKQRNLVDVDYALASLNMSNEASFYGKGNGMIEKIIAPVLHIWGDKDKTVPEMMVLENFKALKKQSTYLKFENCGHSPVVDKPDELTKAILDFIK